MCTLKQYHPVPLRKCGQVIRMRTLMVFSWTKQIYLKLFFFQVILVTGREGEVVCLIKINAIVLHPHHCHHYHVCVVSYPLIFWQLCFTSRPTCFLYRLFWCQTTPKLSTCLKNCVDWDSKLWNQCVFKISVEVMILLLSDKAKSLFSAGTNMCVWMEPCLSKSARRL